MWIVDVWTGKKICNNCYSGKIMIQNHSLDKNFRRLKVPNKHLAKYLHFFSFTYELYKIHNGTVKLLRFIGYSTPFKCLLFKRLCVVCVLLNTEVPFTVAEPEEMVKWNVKSILCGLLLITLYWDWLYISHIYDDVSNSKRLENMEFHYTVEVIRRLCAIWEFFYVFISVDIIHFSIN